MVYGGIRLGTVRKSERDLPTYTIKGLFRTQPKGERNKRNKRSESAGGWSRHGRSFSTRQTAAEGRESRYRRAGVLNMRKEK